MPLAPNSTNLHFSLGCRINPSNLIRTGAIITLCAIFVLVKLCLTHSHNKSIFAAPSFRLLWSMFLLKPMLWACGCSNLFDWGMAKSAISHEISSCRNLNSGHPPSVAHLHNSAMINTTTSLSMAPYCQCVSRQLYDIAHRLKARQLYDIAHRVKARQRYHIATPCKSTTTLCYRDAV